ncbi:peptidase P60 [Virgibacillus kapii]|uniref:Peptidase P60 n=2 Tax=Virgibacillus kapii TaxID=1638645 RepID=A0ABQ2DUK5_9BACI|nr:C40 family peptidase [Virgibacillus kapii]GGJ73485.1 peptidase P60 [Virgibacillus kapii]
MLIKWMKIVGLALIGCLLVSPVESHAADKSLEKAFEAEEGETAYVEVAVATLWTGPNILREVDQPSASNPVDIWKWKEKMTYEQELQLSGDGMLETQALYGNKVTILEKEGDWVKVAVDGQPTPKEELGYSGWMPVSQLTYSKRFAHEADDAFVMVDAPTSHLYHTSSFRHQGMEVSYNTRLPYLGETKHAYRVMLPNGSHAWVKKADAKTFESQEAIPTPTGQALVETGKQFLGLHYLWAGMSGFGFDCSGFTFTIYQSHGITIPRDSSVQATHGEPVAYEDMQPGDLLFFAHDQGKGSVHHVAMYAGDGMMIHSPNSKKDVEIIPVTTEGYYKELSGIRRYIEE